MQKRTKRVTFKQPLTEDRYQDELVEDVPLTPEIEEELARIAQCYKMKLPNNRLNAWRQFQQSQTVEDFPEEPAPRTTEQSPLGRTPKPALVPIPQPPRISVSLSAAEQWLSQQTLAQLSTAQTHEDNSEFAFLRPTLEAAIKAPISEAIAYLKARTFQPYAHSIQRNDCELKLFISADFCVALVAEAGILLNYIVFING